MKDILFLSNGHGEDEIAARILEELQSCGAGLQIDAWPMVGEGDAYRERGVPIVGSPNLLPGLGLARLNANLLLEEIRAGWFPTHWRQVRAARAMTSNYRLAIAVGDVVPLLAVALGSLPFVFVGSAKSSFSGRQNCYSLLERMLLRRHCRMIYPRDALTAREVAGWNLPVRFVGNPMMDGLQGRGERFGISPDLPTVLMLAGSRRDAADNTIDLLSIAADVARQRADARKMRFVFAAHRKLDSRDVGDRLRSSNDPGDWQVVDERPGPDAQGVVMRLVAGSGAEAIMAKGALADAARLALAAVGMAGTANEQAVGLGVPLIAVPTRGPMGERYVKRKMKYFGPAAIFSDRDPQSVAAAMELIFSSPRKRIEMVVAGRERMGEPGASKAIAADVMKILGFAAAADPEASASQLHLSD